MNFTSINAIYGIYYYRAVTMIGVDVARKSAGKSGKASFCPFFTNKKSLFWSYLFIWMKGYNEVLILSSASLIRKLYCFFELLIHKIGSNLFFKIISGYKLKFFSDFLIFVDIVKGVA
jgi:hypothetical protein